MKRTTIRIGSFLLMGIAFLVMNACADDGQRQIVPRDVLAHHLVCSPYTDPGSLRHLYDGLPETTRLLCDRIKDQLIHPVDAGKFGDRIPPGRVIEDQVFPTVADMLAELVRRDPAGLTAERKPGDRLIVACVHHALLLTSVLRSREVPVRIRSGYARYIGGDSRLRVSHVVCEVWDAGNNRWALVDPDRNRVNLKPGQFEFAFETWERLRQKGVKRKFYFSRFPSVEQSTVHLLCHDLSYVIGDEGPYWLDPPIVERAGDGLHQLSESDCSLLDQLAMLLQDPDRHLDELKHLYKTNSSLRFLPSSE